MKFRHFSGFNLNSNFEKLTGDIQRAIEMQANIDLMANKISKYYGKQIKGDKIEEQLFNEFCNLYANKDENTLKRLVISESKALYYYPLTKDRMNYYEQLAMEKASRLDKDVITQVQDHYKQFSR